MNDEKPIQAQPSASSPSASLSGKGVDGKDLPPGVKAPQLETGPGKKLWPLQWVFRLSIGNFYPFPWVMMVLLLVAVIPLVLFSVGVPVPQLSSAPILKDVFAFLGAFSDRDLFVWGTWIVWWPLFIMTILIFRRIWCGGFCPFGLITDIGNLVGNKLRGGKEAKPVNINSYVFMAFLTFLVIGYLHDALNITNSIIMSVEFVLFFFFFAFIVGVMMPRRTFCRSFCFVGCLPHLFGRLAFLGLKTDQNKCLNCKGQWCITGTDKQPVNVSQLRAPLINTDGCPMYLNVPQLGHTESNRHCILCGNCIKNCPYDAIHYKYLTPGYELLKGIQLNGYETFFTLGILAVLSMFVAMEGGLLIDWGKWVTGVFELETVKHQWAVVGSYVLVAAAVIFFLYTIACSMTAAVLRLKAKQCMIYFGYAYLPFTYLMFFRDIFVVYLVDGSAIQVWLGQGPQWFMVIVPFLEMFMILIGAAWSMFLAWRLVQLAWLHQNPTEPITWQEVLSGAAPHLLYIGAFTWYWVDLLFADMMERFSLLGIEPWVPFAGPVLAILAFFILCKMKVFKPFDWEEQQQKAGVSK